MPLFSFRKSWMKLYRHGIPIGSDQLHPGVRVGAVQSYCTQHHRFMVGRTDSSYIIKSRLTCVEKSAHPRVNCRVMKRSMTCAHCWCKKVDGTLLMMRLKLLNCTRGYERRYEIMFEDFTYSAVPTARDWMHHLLWPSQHFSCCALVYHVLCCPCCCGWPTELNLHCFAFIKK